MRRLFKKKLNSDLREAKQTVKEAVRFLRESVPSMRDEQAADLRVVFNELLINAVVHGNKSDKRKIVLLEIEIEDGYMYSRIIDEGAGFDHHKVIEKYSAEANLLSAHGRGVMLAYHMTDHLHLRGSTIEFSKRLVDE